MMWRGGSRVEENLKGLQPIQTMEKRAPRNEINVEEELSPREKLKRRIARTIIELVRRRFYESREKFILRRQLRLERLKRRRVEKQRERELGGAVVDVAEINS